MGTEVDVFITNYTLVDPEIYQLWIEGHTASEAVSILNQRGLGQTTGATLELIASDVLDHYRTYSLLEKLLINPNKLQEQLAFQIEPQTRQLLIEKYYDLDDAVVRELLGKKLTGKHRKDLDEVAEKTGIPLKSCRRQFDNVKRVFKVIEDLPGSVTRNIQNSFYLPEEIAKKYSCVIFLATLRFDIGKRKLAFVGFNAWKQCTEVIIENWTSTGHDCVDVELDKDFLMELREVKVLGEREKEHKQLVCLNLKTNLSQRPPHEIDNYFRATNRIILSLATSIHRPREMKNLFVELSNVCDVFKQTNWSQNELSQFLSIYMQSPMDDIDVIRDSPSLKPIWEKFMKVICGSLLAIYK